MLFSQSLVIPEKFQHILRVLNTNIDGRRKIAFAITAIKVSFWPFATLPWVFPGEVVLIVWNLCVSFLRVSADVMPMLYWGRLILISTKGLESWLRRRWGNLSVARAQDKLTPARWFNVDLNTDQSSWLSVPHCCSKDSQALAGKH